MEEFWGAFPMISEVVGFISNICVLILTVFTLYITAFSKRIDYVSMGESTSAFFGNKIFLYLKNGSLHSIPITKVFLLKKIDGIFHMISIAKYDQPLVIEAWHIGKIESDSFTGIWGLDDCVKDTGEIEENNDEEVAGAEADAEEMRDSPHMNAVIGVESGNKVIWVKPYKKAPLREAKVAYKNKNFEILCVSRKTYGDKTLSKAVNYVIDLMYTDLNGQRSIKSVFAIAHSDNVLLSDSICGYNGLDGSCGESAEELKKCLCDQFGINENSVRVCQFKG